MKQHIHEQESTMAADHRLDDLSSRLERLGLSTRPPGGAGPHYYESGRIHPELDDQTITP